MELGEWFFCGLESWLEGRSRGQDLVVAFQDEKSAAGSLRVSVRRGLSREHAERFWGS